MDSQLQELSTVRAAQEAVLARQENVILHTTQQLKKPGLMHKEVRKVARIAQIEHHKTRGKIADGNQNVINTLSSKLEELCISIPQAPSVATKSNREICFIGGRRESVLLPLLLMKDHVQRAIFHLLSHQVEKVSPQHLYWLQSEFDNLVSSATQEAAAFCQGSTATSFDHWIYSTRVSTLYDTAIPLGTSIFREKGEADKARTESYETGHYRQLRSGHELFSSRFPAGKLRLTVPRNSDVANVAYEIYEAYLSFVPFVGICSSSISARFVKSINSRFEPRLYTQLNAFRLVEDCSLHQYLFARGSIEDIDAAFRNGTISPYDQICGDDSYIICLHLAARYSRWEVLEYLDSKGVGLLALNGELDTLIGLSKSILLAYFGIATCDDLIKTQAYVENRITTCTLTTLNDPLSVVNSKPDVDSLDTYVQLTKAWMEFLKRNNYDFETRDEWGRTPLLDHLRAWRGQSLEIVRLLLGLGANPHAVDFDGRNAIHMAMVSNALFGRICEDPRTLEEKFSLLIEAGVDLRHRDQMGASPSHYARCMCKCWAVWCRALIRNGKKINEVVEKGEEWLLEERSDEYGDEEHIKSEGSKGISSRLE